MEGMSNTSAGLFNRFMDLIRQYAIVNREVNFYSDKLCVTPKYLSEIVRKGSGYPASYWINAFATQEIVRMLKTTDMTIQEIADAMHFYNLSHFSRFTKRMLGLSPTAYRDKVCGQQG
jgi:AraC family transcriptional activator of pobA